MLNLNEKIKKCLEAVPSPVREILAAYLAKTNESELDAFLNLGIVPKELVEKLQKTPHFKENLNYILNQRKKIKQILQLDGPALLHETEKMVAQMFLNLQI